LAGCGATSPLFFCLHPCGAKTPSWRFAAIPSSPFGDFGPIENAAGRVQILSLISASGGVPMHQMMNTEQAAAIHLALISVQSTVTGMTFPRCDQEDLIELIDRVEEQLHASHPNTALMCTFLNSIARSLRAQPEAREACLTIEQAIEAAGMPSTWQSGI
jgi:hypothetical protein